MNRTGLLAAAAFLAASCLPGPAWADNAMGYQLVSQQAASELPRNRGSLGMDIERAQHITDGGMSFDIIRVKAVRRGSPGAQAGFRPGDQIIAVDGRVFASLQAFAGYVGSLPPGTAVSVDYIPANGGPAQAQRVSMTVGSANGGTPAAAPAPAGMSTGTKIAIGAGAAALLGCYEMGCFSHRQPAAAAGRSPNGQSPNGQFPNGQSPNGQFPNGQSPSGQFPNGQSGGFGAQPGFGRP